MKGSYILIIKVKEDLNLKIGKLGKLNFKKGFYCYVGSALGKSANLENRLRRHFKKKKRIRWHIDYLLSNPKVSIEGALIFPSKVKNECKISRIVEKQANFTVKNFGSSDCKCKGHLHYFKTKRDLMHAIEKVSA